MHTHIVIAIVAPLSLGACFDLSFGDADAAPGDPHADVIGGDASAPTPPRADTSLPSGEEGASWRRGVSACDPGDLAWSRALELYRATDDSVHELVACGGAQVGMATTFLARVLLSNPEAIDFDPETRESLESLLGVFGGGAAMIRDGDGSFVMGNAGGSRSVLFKVWFHDGQRYLGDDPLDIASYLRGARITASLTHEEMMADLKRRNHYLITWDEPGPLAYLLDLPEPHPPFLVLELSIWDIASVVLGFDSGEEPPPSFGPFESLGDVRLDSHVELSETPSDALSIAYEFDGGTATVAEIAGSRRMRFDLVELSARSGDLALTSDVADLGYAHGVRGLTGKIAYSITGADLGFDVSADFGAGALYPESVWSCP